MQHNQADKNNTVPPSTLALMARMAPPAQPAPLTPAQILKNLELEAVTLHNIHARISDAIRRLAVCIIVCLKDERIERIILFQSMNRFQYF